MFDTATQASPCHSCARRKTCLGGALVENMNERAPTVTRCVIDKGNHLFRSGDTADTLYVVRSGATKTYVVSAEGEEEIRGFQLANDVAGLDAVCSDAHRGNAKAIGRTWVCRLPAAAVRARMGESSSFRERVLSSLGREFERLHTMLHRERCSADQRVASFLLAQLPVNSSGATEAQDALELPMSRTDLARYLDLATETVSRVFTRLQTRNIVRSQGARCEIVDRAALRALI